MAVITKSIGITGRDYSTFNLWEDDLNDVGVYSSGDDAVGEAYDDSAFDEPLDIFGGATTTLSSITLTVPESERHDGTAGTGVRVDNSSTDSITEYWEINTGRPVEVSFIELNMNNFSRAVGAILRLSNSQGHTARGLLIHGENDNRPWFIHSRFRSNDILNNILYDGVSGGIDAYATTQTILVMNNTVFNTGSDGIVCLDNRGTKTNKIQNNIAVSHSAGDFIYGAAHLLLSSNNLSSDDSADNAGGTGHLINKAAADQFVSTVAGSEDLHLKAGADAIGAGADLSTTPTGVNIDIDGFDRTTITDWDIGADQTIPVVQSVDLLVPFTQPGLHAPTRYKVSAGNEDATENQSGSGFTSSGNELIADASTLASSRDVAETIFDTGLPQGATVHRAWLNVTVWSTSYDSPNATITGEDVDSPANFTTDADVTTRWTNNKTTANVAWTDTNIGISRHDSPDISSVVQELADRAGFAGRLGIFVAGDTDTADAFRFRSYDYAAADAAHIWLDWAAAAGGETPVLITASIASNSAWSADLLETVEFTGLSSTVSNWSADLLETVELDTTLAVNSAWSADLLETVEFTGLSSAESNWTGDLLTGVEFDSTSSTTSAWSADLLETVEFDTTLATTSAWSADLLETVEFTGLSSTVSNWQDLSTETLVAIDTTLTINSAWSADLLETVEFTGLSSIQSAWSADLLETVELSNSISIVSDWQDTSTESPVLIDATLSMQSVWSADLLETVEIDSTLSVSSSWSADLLETVELGLTLNTISSWSADLLETVEIDSSVTVESNWNASSQTVNISIDSNVAINSDWTAELFYGIPITSTQDSVTTWSASLLETVELGTLLATNSAWSADLLETVEFTGLSFTQSSWVAELLETVEVDSAFNISSIWSADYLVGIPQTAVISAESNWQASYAATVDLLASIDIESSWNASLLATISLTAQLDVESSWESFFALQVPITTNINSISSMFVITSTGVQDWYFDKQTNNWQFEKTANWIF